MRGHAADLLRASRLEEHVVWSGTVPPRESRFAPPPYPLASPVVAGLERAGIARLFSHQSEAIGAVREGRSVLVVTPTASGKSLVYNIPVLEACAADRSAGALYLFPYKALEQDQKAAFENLAAGFPESARPRVAIYDGDTPEGERRKIRASPPNVLITNPDMLHLAILAHHQEWGPFLRRLRTIVVDELHVYRGIFGSHLHHIMQRLRRLCRLHGSDPVFISASATVGEPARLARQLLGREFHVVDCSGAPASGRQIVFLDPGMRLSPYTAATRLMLEAMRQERRTLAFTKARRTAELIHSWLGAADPALRSRIASYRAGYLAEDRRRIEERLARGELLGVVATSALELGVDIGGLDVCILVGYPGSIASSWQRIGRVGREERESLVLLVAMPDALDQYFMRHPEEFLTRPFEPVVLDRTNPQVASGHLVCAAAESPLGAADRAAYGEKIFGLVERLEAEGKLLRSAAGDEWHALARRPQRDIGLRSTGRGFEIRQTPGGKLLGTVDGARAGLECHPGAIYLHMGRSYEVRALDLDRGIVEAAPAFDADFFTQPLTEKQTEILERLESADHGAFRAGLGRVKVTTFFRGYVRRRITDQAVLSEHPLELPPAEFETVGMWVELPAGLPAAVAGREGHLMGAIHATEHASIALFPLLAVCDRSDIGGISYPAHPQIGGPAYFIYDGHPGGIGLAEEGYRRIGELVARTRDLLAGCPCAEGCPSCVQSPKCGNGNRPLDKETALYLLRVLAGDEPSPPSPSLPSAAQDGTPLRGAGPRPAAAPMALAREGERGGGDPAPQDVFFDLETLRSAEEVGGWDRASSMGLALAVVYDRAKDRWRTYREPEARDLILDLFAAGRVVGFNVRRFDYAVLSGYAPADLGRIPTLDLLDEVRRTLGFRLSLAHLAEATLGEAKQGDGLASLEWVRQGRWDLVETYCRKDVELTLKLYDFGRREGHLLFRDRQGRVVRLPASWA